MASSNDRATWSFSVHATPWEYLCFVEDVVRDHPYIAAYVQQVPTGIVVTNAPPPIGRYFKHRVSPETIAIMLTLSPADASTEVEATCHDWRRYSELFRRLRILTSQWADRASTFAIHLLYGHAPRPEMLSCGQQPWLFWLGPIRELSSLWGEYRCSYELKTTPEEYLAFACEHLTSANVGRYVTRTQDGFVVIAQGVELEGGSGDRRISRKWRAAYEHAFHSRTEFRLRTTDKGLYVEAILPYPTRPEVQALNWFIDSSLDGPWEEREQAQKEAEDHHPEDEAPSHSDSAHYFYPLEKRRDIVQEYWAEYLSPNRPTKKAFAQRHRISRQTLDNYIKEFPELKPKTLDSPDERRL